MQRTGLPLHSSPKIRSIGTKWEAPHVEHLVSCWLNPSFVQSMTVRGDLGVCIETRERLPLIEF